MAQPAIGRACRRILASEGIIVPDDAEARLAKHCALIREWHDYLSLVSTADLAVLEREHIPDALSLAALVRRYGGSGLLDIGPGGGYPAIPLAVVLPEVPMVLVERSVKKIGFLRKVCGALGLANVRLVAGEFPRAAGEIAASVITARAVENPARIQGGIMERVYGGAVWLCQTRVSRPDEGETFHVEHVDDRWKSQGLRRSALQVVRRA